MRIPDEQLNFNIFDYAVIPINVYLTTLEMTKKKVGKQDMQSEGADIHIGNISRACFLERHIVNVSRCFLMPLIFFKHILYLEVFLQCIEKIQNSHGGIKIRIFLSSF